ncbi:MAG: biotin carboxylase, partial [Acidimicrobiales bacterium]|nr:biotin carboxylase [Acidimicrobiales bacterium]
VARRLVGYFQGRTEPGPAADQALLRDALPEREREAYDVTPIVELLCDVDSVTFLREAFAPELVTALGRIDGRPVGLIANQTTAMAGSVTAAGSDKAARFIQLCDAFGLPVIALVDTPGILAGPDAERTAILRHASRLLV